MANSSPAVLQTVFHSQGSSSTCPESSTFPEFAAERRVRSLLSHSVLPVSHEPLAPEKWRLATPPTSSGDPIKHKLPSIHITAPERGNGSIFLGWGPEAGGFVLKFRPIRRLFRRGCPSLPLMKWILGYQPQMCFQKKKACEYTCVCIIGPGETVAFIVSA